MNALIPLWPLTLAGNATQAVDARELHAFLEVGKDFSTWIKDRISQYGFLENQDFGIFPNSGEKSGRGRPTTEYAITIGMAKELSMVERNEKGKQARQYFIECERRLRESPAVDPMTVLADPAAMRGLLLVYTEKVLALESTVAEQTPKVAALDRISSADGSLCMRDAAKALQVRPIDLKSLLLAERWIYGRPGHSGWLAYQDRIQQGVLIHKVSTVARQDGSEKIVEQVRVTPKGMAKLGEMLVRAEAA